MAEHNEKSMKTNEPVRLVFVVEGRMAVAPYLDAVRSEVEDVTVVSSIGELFTLMAREAFNGILLDVPTLVRASSTEKASLYDLIQVFPTLRVKWDSRSSTVRALFYDRVPGPGAGLGSFVRQVCARFVPRIIRRRDRVAAHLNVMVSETPSFSPEKVIRTVSLNLSLDGCFLIAVDPWLQGTRLWLRMLEIDDQTPIAAEVRWRKPWGVSPGIAGAGVRFLELTDEQRKCIVDLCEQNRVVSGI